MGSGLWSLIAWIAANPHAGAVIRGTRGCRKVRWYAGGRGKRSGARVIYAIGPTGIIWLLLVTSKSALDALPATFLDHLRQEIEDEPRR